MADREQQTGRNAQLHAEKRFGFFHTLNDVHMEGAALLTAAACNAVRSMFFQIPVMLCDRGRHAILRCGQIVELVDHGNVNAGRTGLTMVAVCTHIPVRMVCGGSKHRRIILFFFRGRFIGDGSVNLIRIAVSNQNRSDGGTRQRIMQTLFDIFP